MPHQELVAEMLRDPAVRAEYDALAPQLDLLDELLRARQRAGLTQAEVAERMGARPPAVGCRLEVRLLPVPTPADQ